MRVICIDDKAWPTNTIIKPEDGGILEVGETYEVTDVEMDDGYIWYFVNGLDDGSYWENCFQRCSDVDELEIHKEKELVSSFNL